MIGQNENCGHLMIAFTGQYKMLHSVLQQENKLKETLEHLGDWGVKWIVEKRGEYKIPLEYFSGYGHYLCLCLPLESMFFLKIKLVERISEHQLNLLPHLVS